MRYGLPEIGPLERALHLRSLPIFRHLGAGELAACAQLTQERYIRRGEVLYEEHQAIRALYLLVDGRVHLQRQGRSISELGASDDVGLVEFLAGVPHSLRAVADTNALALVIDGAALMDLVEEHFPLFLQMRHALGGEVAQQQRLLRSYHTLTDTQVPAASQPAAGSSARPAPQPTRDFAEMLLALQHTAVFRDVGVALLAALISADEEMHVAAGTALWQRGEDASYLALVTDGRVACAPEDERDSFQANSGTLLGVDAVFGDTPYAYSATAATPVSLCRIETQMLLDLAEDHFDLAARILAQCASELLRLKELASAGADTPVPPPPTHVPAEVPA